MNHLTITATMKNTTLFLLIPLLVGCVPDPGQSGSGGIDISAEYPRYWEYDGEPVLLLGGSDEDNLFQMPGLEAQLDFLAGAGGNYVRNTMSSRDSGNLWPFYMDPATGKYDLNEWNEPYWERFSKLLELTSERKIFVQVEVWATFDFYRDNWDVNPFNPANNINYTSGRTRLPAAVDTHPIFCDNPFFWSVPSHHNNMPVLTYQQHFVDRLLSISLAHDHVLYCIDNETSVTSEWGRFWSDYIRKRAAEEGKKVHVTEMWDPWDLDHISHRESFDHPEIYSFVEISQNNHQRGEAQWNNGLKQIGRLAKAGNLRPVNNVKTYGHDGGRHGGGTHNGIESFVRSTLFGSAAVRFHRPPTGLGLGDTARAVIGATREATGRIAFFDAEPRNDLLSGREENEAYCRAVPGKDYLVYFPDAGEVELHLQGPAERATVVRAEILKGEWTDQETETAGEGLLLRSPGKHHFFIVHER